MTIFSAHGWSNNAALIADVARLGYLDGPVLDCTYGHGRWWTEFRPADLTASDLDQRKSPVGFSIDFRSQPWRTGAFRSVCFDPPFRLNGTPDRGEFDERYGIEEYTRWQDRYQLIYDGLTECARVARQYVLLKCQNQVCSGKKRWQTYDFTKHMESLGWALDDEFHMLRQPRKQPAGRRQVHTQINYSTLLAFMKA